QHRVPALAWHSDAGGRVPRAGWTLRARERRPRARGAQRAAAPRSQPAVLGDGGVPVGGVPLWRGGIGAGGRRFAAAAIPAGNALPALHGGAGVRTVAAADAGLGGAARAA